MYKMPKLLRRMSCGMAAILLSSFVLAANTENAQVENVKTSKSKASMTNSMDSKANAERWGLTVDEWGRYLEIKKGPRGVWSPNLDPIAMLALEARSDQEARYYATMYAHMQDERIQAELTVDRYRREAVQKIYAGKVNTFNQAVLEKIESKQNEMLSNPMALSNPSDTLTFGDRLLYFVDATITPKDFVQRLMSRAGENAGINIDIYISGASDDSVIKEWARKVNIDPELVRSKAITLNHENGALSKFSSDSSKSQLFLRRAGATFRVQDTSL